MTLTAACALAAGTITVGNQTYTNLKAAAYAAHTSGTPVIISGEVNETSGFNSNLNVTFKAAPGGGTINFKTNGYTAAHGCNFTFEGLNIKYSDSGIYTGIAHLASAKYISCTIIGQFFNYAPEVSFTDCVFTQKTGNYNIWTYSAETATFTDCVFDAAGKFVLIYHDSPTTNAISTDAVFTNCDFVANDKFTDTGKAALEVDGRFIKSGNHHNIVMTGCEIDCRIPAVFRDKEHADFNTTTAKTSFKQTGTTIAHIDDNCGHPQDNGVAAGAPAAGGASMPQTGDNSSLMLWASVMVLCAAAFVMLNRKRASN